MARTAEEIYADLTECLKTNALLESCGSVLGWDEQTNMPPGGAEHRANHLSLLAGLCHERTTAPALGDLLADLESSPLTAAADSAAAANIREARRDYDRATKLPRRLVEELSHTCTLSQQAWVAARKQSKFADFQPWLEKVVALKREEAQAIGFPAGGVPYDALLDAFEPGMTSAELTRLFAPMRKDLVELIGAIRESNRQPQHEILERSYPVAAQREGRAPVNVRAREAREHVENPGFRQPAASGDVEEGERAHVEPDR